MGGYVAIMILSFLVGALLGIALKNKEILEVIEENYELLIWKQQNKDAVERSISSDRKLRRIRLIIQEDSQNNELHTVTLSKIKKELLMNR